VTDAQGRAGTIALAIITALAFFTRFYMLDHPNEVVFDEVHFGKFASYVPDPSTMSRNSQFRWTKPECVCSAGCPRLCVFRAVL